MVCWSLCVLRGKQLFFAQLFVCFFDAVYVWWIHFGSRGKVVLIAFGEVCCRFYDQERT
jgi:hypothetical protein